MTVASMVALVLLPGHPSVVVPASVEAGEADQVEVLAPASDEDMNTLDLPAVDVAFLRPMLPDEPARILRIRVPEGEAPLLELLTMTPGVAVDGEGRRAASGWIVADSRPLPTPGPRATTTPWLVRLGPDERFVVIGGGALPSASRLTPLEVAGTQLVVAPAIDVAGTIEGAGAADTEGDGDAEVVLAGPPEPGSVAGVAGSCATVLRVLDGRSFAEVRRIDAGPYQFGGAALAELDGRPGVDLAVSVTARCLGRTGGDDRNAADDGDVIGLRLADGEPLGLAHLDASADRLAGPLPVRVDPAAPDLLVALDGARTVIVDPAWDWVAVDALPVPARPLGVGRAQPADRPSARPLPVGAPLVLVRVEGGRSAELEIVRVVRTAEGPGVSERREVAGSGLGAWEATRPVGRDLLRWPFAWSGDVDADDCPDLVVPLLIVTCASGSDTSGSDTSGSDTSASVAAVRHGPAWIATRPLATIPGETPRLLVASSLAWDPGGDGLLDPTPLPAWDTTGGWRGGPSAPFALAELSADDLTYFADFPIPVPTVDRSIGRHPLETIAAGQSGDRVFVRWRPIGVDQIEAPVEEPALSAALRQALAPDQRAIVIRSPVRRGGLSGVEDGPMSLPLGRPGEAAEERAWRIDIVAVNDWGEVAGPVATNVSLDVLGPGLVVDTPLVSAPWPFRAPITGRAEPGARVTLGDDTVEANRSGGFELRTSLAPWPHSLEIRAVDGEGNETVRRVSVMGGLDVRRLPWQAGLAALVLAAIAWTAFTGAATRPGRVRGDRRPEGADTADELAQATIEDLEPADKPSPW